MSRKHVGLAPFEDGGEVQLEQLSRKYDCGLFVVANHTKSKPHNLVFGRFFDHRIYDMIELGVTEFQSIQGFASRTSFPQGLKVRTCKKRRFLTSETSAVHCVYGGEV